MTPRGRAPSGAAAVTFPGVGSLRTVVVTAVVVVAAAVPTVVFDHAAVVDAQVSPDGWPTEPRSIEDLRVRDPFVIADPTTGWHYLVVTGAGVRMFRSRDLTTWYGPKRVFEPPADYWATDRTWAPEIRRWQGRWYLFVSFATTEPPTVAAGDVAGTAVAVSNAIDGPYLPVRNGPLTPPDRFALDGHLYVDPVGDPWLVYSQEWIDPRLDFLGRMAVVRVTDDLISTIGDPVELWDPTDAPWTLPLPLGRIIDGPWVHEATDGSLLMLWTATGRTAAYTTGVARSASGSITGPWEHLCLPFYDADGGHASLFTDLDGDLRAAFHSPNSVAERARFPRVAERDGTLVITEPGYPESSDAACPDEPLATTTTATTTTEPTTTTTVTATTAGRPRSANAAVPVRAGPSYVG